MAVFANLWPPKYQNPELHAKIRLCTLVEQLFDQIGKEKFLTLGFKQVPFLAIERHYIVKNGCFCQSLTTSISKPWAARENPTLHAGRATLRPYWERKIFNPGLPKMSIFGHWTSLHGQNDYFCECLTTKIWKPWTARANPALHADRATLWPNWEIKFFNPRLPKMSIFGHWTSLSNPFFSKLRWTWKRVIIAINISTDVWKYPNILIFIKKLRFNPLVTIFGQHGSEGLKVKTTWNEL